MATTKNGFRRLVRELERSGLSHREFAERRGVSLHTLRYWLYRMRAEDRGPDLLPVSVIASPAPVARDGEVELVLAGGLVLRVAVGTEPAYVAALVRALG
jgi:transposase